MAGRSTGFGQSIEDAIRAVGVVEAEIDNVIEAAIRDLCENLVQKWRTDWPRGARAEGETKPHSAGLWRSIQDEKLKFRVVNTAEYAEWVHQTPKYGGPPGLAERLLEQDLRTIQAEPLAFVSERTAELIVAAGQGAAEAVAS
jgi:hypothetical protein